MAFVNLMAYNGTDYKSKLNYASLILTQDVITYWLDSKGIPKFKAVVGIPL